MCGSDVPGAGLRARPDLHHAGDGDCSRIDHVVRHGRYSGGVTGGDHGDTWRGGLAAGGIGGGALVGGGLGGGIGAALGGGKGALIGAASGVALGAAAAKLASVKNGLPTPKVPKPANAPRIKKIKIPRPDSTKGAEQLLNLNKSKSG